MRGLDVTWQPVPEETLLGILEQTLSRGASQLAVRRQWLCLRNVWPSLAQISSLSTVILASGKAFKSQAAKSGLQWGWETRVMWCFAKKASTRAVE